MIAARLNLFFCSLLLATFIPSAAPLADCPAHIAASIRQAARTSRTSSDVGAYFYLNGYGVGANYNIYRFDSDGFASPDLPVIGPLAGNSGAGVIHIAQPSAVRLSDRIRVFAVRYDGSAWFDIAYWDSFDGGVTFGLPAVAITAASSDAPFGLVDPTVYVATGDAIPCKMVFGVRQASSVPATIKIATSADCSSWVIGETVFTQGADAWQAAVLFQVMSSSAGSAGKKIGS